MFDHHHYVPAIKWKRGERVALEKLKTEQLEEITPLIEIQPIPFDHGKNKFKRSLDEHLINIGEDIKSFWSEDRPLFVDAHTLFDDSRISSDITLDNGQTPLEFIINDIENNKIEAVPVTSILRYDSYHDAIEACLKEYNRGLALRLEQRDFENFNKFKGNLSNWLSFYDISPNDVDIILDFKEIDPDKKSTHLDGLTLLIAKFPHIKRWRTFTILSTSMTQGLSQIPTGTNSEIPRIEWEVYTDLLNRGLGRFPSYGDYNIGHPDWFDFDPRKMNIGANIKYTVGDRFLIFRGRGVRQYGFEQMRKLCTDTINHPKYSGKNFSFGDKYIFNCATNPDYSTGNPETWVRVNVNHHLTFIINQLTNIHVNEVG